MRSDTSERRLVTGSRATRNGANNFTGPSFGATSAPTCDALDEAFENYTRIDVGTTSKPTAHAPKTEQSKVAANEIISDIAAQLDALDRQRQRLSNLLRDIQI